MLPNSDEGEGGQGGAEQDPGDELDAREAGAASASDHASDILNALLALGYSEKEALAAIKNVPAGTGVSEGIKLALKALSKG